jgi:hypothetical protein
VLRDGFRPHAVVNRGSGGVGFQGVVMMGELTPVSLGLVDLLAAPAAQLLDRAVLPGRAKCVRYTGSSGWHRDREIAIPSMSFVTYLAPLDANSGALRVFPRSHRETASPATDELALETVRARSTTRSRGAGLMTRPPTTGRSDHAQTHAGPFRRSAARGSSDRERSTSSGDASRGAIAPGGVSSGASSACRKVSTNASGWSFCR